LGLRQRLCKENKQRRCETLMQIHRVTILDIGANMPILKISDKKGN
jgi:hypothetical protein